MDQEAFNLEQEIAKVYVSKGGQTKGTYLLAEYLTRKYDIITVGEKEREMYVYQNGVYKRGENLIILPEIQRILYMTTNKSAKSETLHKIADMTSSERSIFTNADPRYIPLANGVFDRATKKLLPHNAKYRFRYQFPIMYNPKAKCPKTSAFLDQVLSLEQRATVEEWLGYYFYRNYMFKKAIIFVGEGDTGKTTLLEVITHLLGKENLSAVSLHKMTSDKFAAAHLYEKHGNVVDELSAKDVTDTGNFKIATGGGSITGEYKFGNQFSFVNFSKFTFACNRIPDVDDFDDEAYFNRWMVIRFEKTIEKKIPNFIASLTSDEERSGLFNLAMKGLTRLLENGHFTYSSTATDTKLEMMRNGSSVARFVKDRITKTMGASISKEDMYEAYQEFCDANDLRTETIIAFGKTLKFYASYINDGLISGLRGGAIAQVKGWRNVSLRPTEEQLKELREVDDFMNATREGINKINEEEL
jgi:P4 family phage/plasmid primase-like protien